eukprot:jgi/Tetstr1/425531/TSEL_001542.t1
MSTHETAAGEWGQAAQTEHASVASFSCHLPDLMVVGGAPPGILQDVATAAADKVGHAAASLQVARLLRGGAQSAKDPDRLPQQLGAPRLLRDLAAAVL